MKFWIGFVALVILIFLIGCEDDPASPSSEIWFELEADTLSGVVPLTVDFVGTLHGNIQNLTLNCPDPVFCIAYQKPCVIFCPIDSTYSVKRTYEIAHTFNRSGEYWVCLLLPIVDELETEVISSDTLLVTVIE